MNADEVVRAFRICAKHGYCDNCPAYQLDGDCLAPVMIRAADLIESLQAQLAKAQSDLDIANGRLDGMTEGVGQLRGMLAEAERRERAAVEDLKFACGSQPSASAEDSICDICKQKQEDGSCPKQLAMDFLNTDLHIFVPRDLYRKYKLQGWDKKRFERRAEK